MVCAAVNFEWSSHECFWIVPADMHELTLIHTDLKPENILLVSTEYIKVLDYKVTVTLLPAGNCVKEMARVNLAFALLQPT